MADKHLLLRPIRVALAIGGLLAVIVCILCPFIVADRPKRFDLVSFTAWGIAYPFLLSFVAVGVLLQITGRLFFVWILSSGIPAGCLAAALIFYGSALEGASERELEWLKISSAAWLALGCVVSAIGWARFWRSRGI